MRISDWISDVCSSDLHDRDMRRVEQDEIAGRLRARRCPVAMRNADRVIELKPTFAPPHAIFVRIVFGKGKVGYGGRRLGKGIAKTTGRGTENGSASWKGRVFQYVLSSGVAIVIQKKNTI